MTEQLIDVRSDDLARFKAVADRFPGIREVAAPFEDLPLVIDTNQAISEVTWGVRKRNAHARTMLQELCASSLVSIYAPEHMVDEVERNLPIVSEETGLPLERLQEEWARFSPLVRFIPAEHLAPTPAGSITRDPSDLPFLAARDAVAAHGILSKDKDLPAMGAVIMDDAALRSAIGFVRDQSRYVFGTYTGTSSVALVCGLGYGLFKVGAATVSAFRRLPLWLQILLPVAGLGATLFVALHPPTRKRVRRAFASWKPRLSEFAARAAVFIDRFLTEMEQAREKARAALRVVRERVPTPTRKPTVKQLIYRACLDSPEPLPEYRIEDSLRARGYASTSPNARKYITAVLRRDRRLVHLEAGWTLTRRVAPTRRITAHQPNSNI